GNGNWSFKEARFLNPRGTGHFAIAILAEPPCIDRIGICFAACEEDSNAGTHRPLAHLQRTISRDKRSSSNFDAAHIRDCIQRPRSSIERYAKIPCPL